MKYGKRLPLLILTLLIFIVQGCSSKETNDGKLQLYTSIFAIEELTNYIGGDYVNVINLIPNGADAHTYEPTAKQMVDIANADGFLYVGIGMEGFIERLRHSLENENVMFVEVSKDISTNQSEHDEHHDEEDEHHDEEDEDEHGHDDHKNGDPHIWLDPILAIELANNIKDALIELQPEHQETFEKNYTALTEQLNSLYDEFNSVIANTNQRSFIVSHAAYGYWENRFGLNQLAITGLSPASEPSQKQLQALIEYALEHEIKYVLFEQNVSPRVAKVLQKEIDAQPLTLHNLSVRTKDDNKEDYFSLMRQNLKTLEKALR